MHTDIRQSHKKQWAKHLLYAPVGCGKRIPFHIRMIFLLVALIIPHGIRGLSSVADRTEPFEQEFFVTAYYSPLEGQCCYIRGGLKADRMLNGEGHTTADGTPVFAGIAAAPSSYPFGTQISLPGLGTVEVHDRGGAIQELPDGIHRIDLWVGEGEEGLSRALALGGLRMKGTVYPPKSTQPGMHFDLATLEHAWEKLRVYLTAESGLLNVRPRLGDVSLSVTLLQEHLKTLGYFRHPVTGKFGSVTENALRRFLRDVGLREPSDHVTDLTASYVLAALQRKNSGESFAFVGPDSASSAVKAAQRTLRFLGFYRGRTDGAYNDTLFHVILGIQRTYGLVGTAEDPGAGRIGPLTLERLRREWSRKHIAMRANDFLMLHKITDLLAQRGERIEQFLGEGHTGDQVRHLQLLLADEGLFPPEKINGVFGSLTKESVLRYQLTYGLIENSDHEAAGYVGPATMRHLLRSRVHHMYHIVRGNGWQSL